MKCCCILLGWLPTLAFAGHIALETPTGGWTDSRLNPQENTLQAAYPKPPVDRGQQKARTLITGQLAAAGKQRIPHTLVVNGNPMPLYTDANGNFSRPYAFGSGSNGVEIHAPNGEKKRVQFYEANSHKTPARLRVILSWNDPRAEVDLHVLSPDGEHAFWAHPLLNQGGGFDVDSVDGAGPEIFSTATPSNGSWLLYVNYWGNFDEAGYNFNENRHEKPLITTTISIITHENTPDERRETFVVPLRKLGELIPVRQFHYP